MKATLRWMGCAVVAMVAFESTLATAQAFPTRPVRVLVPSTPGGSVDTLARLIGKHFSETFGHQAVVDNRPRARRHRSPTSMTSPAAPRSIGDFG